MAKKNSKIEIGSYEQDFVSNEETFIEEVIKPAVEDHLGDKVRNLRSKGYNANQIASMLMIHKHIVENIK